MLARVLWMLAGARGAIARWRARRCGAVAPVLLGVLVGALGLAVGTASLHAQPAPPAGVVVHAPARHAGLADRLSRRTPALAVRVGDRLGIPAPEPPQIYLESNAAGLCQRVQALGGTAPPGSGRQILGVAFPTRGVIVLNLGAIGGSAGDPSLSFAAAVEATLAHELAHLALARYESARRLPVWFEEGVCQWVEQTPNVNRAWLSVRSGQVDAPALSALEARMAAGDDLGFAYALAQSAVDFWIARYGLPALVRLLEAFSRGTPFPAAHAQVTGEPLGTFERAWQATAAPGGLIALVTFLGAYWFVLLMALAIGIALIGAWFKRRRHREIIAAMEAEDPGD